MRPSLYLLDSLLQEVCIVHDPKVRAVGGQVRFNDSAFYINILGHFDPSVDQSLDASVYLGLLAPVLSMSNTTKLIFA